MSPTHSLFLFCFHGLYLFAHKATLTDDFKQVTTIAPLNVMLWCCYYVLECLGAFIQFCSGGGLAICFSSNKYEIIHRWVNKSRFESCVGLLFRSDTFDSNWILLIYINHSPEMYFLNTSYECTCLGDRFLSSFLGYLNSAVSSVLNIEHLLCTNVCEQQHISVFLIWECNSVGLILIWGHRILMSFLMFGFILIKCSTDFQKLEEGLSIYVSWHERLL